MPQGKAKPWKSVLAPTVQRLLSPYLDKYGYYVVYLSHPKMGNVKVHRLVLLAFIGPCPPGQEACHNDGTRTNNYPSNLRWDTRKNNQHDQRKHGTDLIGERNGSAKLSEGQVKQIRSLYSQGKHSQYVLGEMFNVNESSIFKVIHYQTWSHIP